MRKLLAAFAAAATLAGIGIPLTLTADAATTVKPPVTGTLNPRSEPSSTQRAMGTDSWVVDIPWSSVQPNNSDTLTTGAIDNAVQAARAWNSTHSDKTVRIKLRVSAGVDAPDFVKNIGGSPLTVADQNPRNPTTTATMGRWWLPAYADAYGHLEQLLAAKYDSEPTIGDFVLCESSVFGCDGTKQMGDSDGGPDNSTIFANAGYTEAQDIAAQEKAIDYAAQYWTQTRVEQAQFQFQIANKDGSVGHSFDDNFKIMDYQIATLGPARTVEASYNLNGPRSTDPGYTPIYDRMKQDAQAGKAAVGFQTGAISSASDLCDGLAYAAPFANFVELTKTDGLDTCDASQISKYDADFESNPYPTGSTPPPPSPSPSPTPPPPSPSPSPSPTQPPASGAPTVVNGQPTDVTDSSATAHCTVDPNGADTTVWVTYKPSADAWGGTTVAKTDGTTVTGTGARDVAQDLVGLNPASSYDLRCKVSNANVTSPVVDTNTVTFTTATTPPPPPAGDGTVTTGLLPAVEVHCDVTNASAVWVTYKKGSDPDWSTQQMTAKVAPDANGGADPLLDVTADQGHFVDYRCDATQLSDGTTIAGTVRGFQLP